MICQPVRYLSRLFRYFTALITLFQAIPVSSQDYLDLGKFSYEITPRNDYKDGSEGIGLNEWDLQLDLPVVLNKKSALITGFTGNQLKLGLDPSLPDGSKIFSLALRFGLNRQYSETWSATWLLIPKFSSDFEAGFHDGFQLGLATLVNYIKSVKLKYTFGLYANSEEYGLLIVPLFGGYYQSPDERLETTLLLPSTADINYKLSPTFRLGMNFDGLGSTFLLHDPNFDHAYVTRSSNELFAYVRLALDKSIYINLKAGYPFHRTYKVYDLDDKVTLSLASIYFGNNRTVLNTVFEDNFIFKIDLVYRVFLNKKER